MVVTIEPMAGTPLLGWTVLRFTREHLETRPMAVANLVRMALGEA